jgi:hypothetical protein
MDEKRNMTRRLVDYIQQRSLVRTFTEVADDVGVNEKTVRNVFREYVALLEEDRERLEQVGELTPGQLVAAVKTVERMDKLALLPDAPEGRVVVVGTVKKCEWRDNDFGGSLKMLVESVDGWRVWCSCPSGLSEALGRPESYVGATVTFKATLTRSNTDAKFCFGKIPKLVSAALPTV